MRELYDRGLDLPKSGHPDRRDGVVITSLYRLYDEDDDLLYVGISSRLLRRLRVHQRRQVWGKQICYVEWVEFTDRAEAEAAERQVIHNERPLHNVIHRRQ